MIAFFVHDSATGNDMVVLPEMACAVAVDRKVLEKFISPSPNFAEWSGDACDIVSPGDLGVVAASRDDQGDVDILEQDLWRKRMDFHMTRA